MSWFHHFVDNYDVLEEEVRRIGGYSSINAGFEPVQEPKFYPSQEGVGNIHQHEPTISADLESKTSGDLGPRTLGDGAENPDNMTEENRRFVRFDETVKKYDGKTPFNEKVHSIQIAAKYSEV